MRALLYFVVFFIHVLWAELPSGNTTITGDISISFDTQTMTIDQQSDQAIIEWNSFNIGENNTLPFNNHQVVLAHLIELSPAIQLHLQDLLTPMVKFLW